ncbi:MAG: helix-turn-helix domain-containing protein [Lachnospiraceae bacterium]|nr:helix-turn-helix domain-containing protein [Lachnospiraceae bacterium]
MAKYEEWIEPEGLLRIEGWARDGLTDEQIAANMGIGTRTLYDWKEKYPQILQTLKKGKDIADRQVENALFRRAVGYKAVETVKERNDEGELVVTKEVTKEVPPDTAAGIFWLKNRKPNTWRDKPNQEIDGKDKVIIVDIVPDNS